MTERNHPDTHSGQAPGRFLARVQPEGAWRWGAGGWALLATAAAIGGVVACSGCLFGPAMLPDAPSSAIALLAVGLLLVAAICAALTWLGVVLIRAGRHLDRLTWISVDQQGIGQYDGVWTVTPWPQVRHVVWPHRPDSFRSSVRWALVDTGGGARTVDRSPTMAVLDLARRRRRYACHLPVDALNVEAGELLQAIRRFSQGRFPDL